MDGGVLHTELGCDVSITKAIEAFVLQERFRHVQDCPFGILNFDHFGHILLTS